MRDPNTRIMMGSLVSKESPMFDYIDQLVGKSNLTKG